MFFQLFTVFIVELFRKLLNVDSQSSVTTSRLKQLETVFTQSPCGSQSQSQSGSQFTSHDRNHNRGLKVVRAVTISVIKVSHHSQSQSFFSSDSDCGSSKGSCTQWSQSRIIVLVTILVAVIVLISVADCARPVFFEPCTSRIDPWSAILSLKILDFEAF